MKKILIFAMLGFASGLLFSCTSDIEPIEQVLERVKSSSSLDPSSSSLVPSSSSSTPSSSSEIPSSSSLVPSSSSEIPSSSSLVPSSSSEIPSSSSLVPSSSSEIPSSSSLDPSSSSLVPSSSSLAPSSSSEIPSSSSLVPSSSSSALPSSSSVVTSSSSVEPSSSSALPSSSSVASSSSSYGGLCAGFVYGTEREHYGKMKKQFCDERDGKRYVYVTIGTQTWMAENLNYAASGSKCGDGSSLSDNNTTSCDTYGRLYNWSTAMNNSASSTAVPSGVRGVCPNGWHLPSEAEWEMMTDYIGGASTEGIKLKAKSGWDNYNGALGNGTDDYGFSALPGGYGYSDWLFGNPDYAGNWWSSTVDEDFGSYAYYRHIGYNDEGADWFDSVNGDLFSVRCVRDVHQ